MNKQWFYLINRTDRQGPVSTQELLTLLDEGTLQASDLVWTAGMSTWKSIESLPAFQPGAADNDPDMESSSMEPLPQGLTTWTGLVGIMNILVGAFCILTCFGALSGILMVVAGISLLGAKTALDRVDEVNASLVPFLFKLKTFMVMTGIGYVAGLVIAVVGLIVSMGFMTTIIGLLNNLGNVS